MHDPHHYSDNHTFSQEHRANSMYMSESSTVLDPTDASDPYHSFASAPDPYANYDEHLLRFETNDNGSPGPAEFIVEEEQEDPEYAALPRILLMGPRRSGKTSIQRVVFHKMSPHETLFRLEATQQMERTRVDHTPLCRFAIWDFPGDYYLHTPPEDDPSDAERAIYAPPSPQGTTALVFVMDAQDEPYDHVLQNFISTISRAVRVNPHSLTIEVFINKVDGELFLSDEAKYDCRRDIMQQVTDELSEAQLDHFVVSVNYHLVSIYDHSIFEALSRVVQKILMPHYLQPTLENMLNTLVASCSMEKAYLFDVANKLYISTDSTPVDMQSVELCSDMIDVVLDVSGIYGQNGDASSSVIRLSNGMVLYLKQVDTMLALISLSRSEHFRKRALVDYNIACFKRALVELTKSETIKE